MVTSELARRLLAGMWFATAAVIPVAYYLLFSREDGVPQFRPNLPMLGGSSVLAAGIPVIIAGICGLLLGAAILDPEEIKSAGQALGRGLIISLLSYWLLFTISLFIVVLNSTDFAGLVVLFVTVFLYGLLLVGWLVAGVGAAAGLLLYVYRLKSLGA